MLHAGVPISGMSVAIPCRESRLSLTVEAHAVPPDEIETLEVQEEAQVLKNLGADN